MPQTVGKSETIENQSEATKNSLPFKITGNDRSSVKKDIPL